MRGLRRAGETGPFDRSPPIRSDTAGNETVTLHRAQESIRGFLAGSEEFRITRKDITFKYPSPCVCQRMSQWFIRTIEIAFCEPANGILLAHCPAQIGQRSFRVVPVRDNTSRLEQPPGHMSAISLCPGIDEWRLE